MRYWDQSDLPFTYSLVKHFPIGERYFSSVLAQTFPNRRFFFAGTASGTINDRTVAITAPAANGTIWDRLDAHQVNWGIYYEVDPAYTNVPTWLIVPGSSTPARAHRVAR